jgi:biopolymer transport protein ExbD
MASSHTDSDGEITGINVTPLVDIMLVLLIIFMVATNLDKPGEIGVDLPRASTASETQPSTLSVVIGKDGGLKLDGAVATLDAIEAAAHHSSPDAQAVISADKGASYDRVVGVVDRVRKGGVHKLALSAEVEQ